MSAKPATPPSFPSLTPHSLFPIPIPPVPVNAVHHHQMDAHVSSHPRYPSTCIPSVMPPGVDPTSVDFRTFFPYIPNEVKHRKRTSRHQLKVLEDIFRKDTKPNAVLRKKLATDLEMSPRAVQVWFQNRRAKEKALRKRVSEANGQDQLASPSTKMSPPSRDASPIDSSTSSTATEKPTRLVDDDHDASPPMELPSPSPVLKLSCSPPLLPDSPLTPWPGSAPLDIPPYIRPPSILHGQDADLYSTRRGSLPTVMPSQPLVGPNVPQAPIYYPDRRKSMDVDFFRLVHHPFARIAKEKNEALYLPKFPPPGSAQAGLTRAPGIAPGVGPIRTNGHGYPHPRPTLSHRASEPQVFAPARPPFLPVPESGPPLQSVPAPLRRFCDNRPYAITSRPLTSPIPGPLPTPDFQFGDPSSSSSSNASPTPGETESPPLPLHSPDIAQLHNWSFPRSREVDQDTEDSGSYSGLSRFGSVASITGSDSSAMYSDVSSCVDPIGYDPSARRGSCASGNLLEMRLSGLNMTGRSSQGSLNEAHLNAATAHAYRDKLVRQERSPEVIGGFTSKVSPGTSPHIRQVKEPAPSGLRNEGMYDYGPLSQVPETDEIAIARRGSIQAQESIPPHIYMQDHMEQQTAYPTPPSEARAPSVQPAIQEQHYSSGSSFTSPSGFSHSGESPFSGPGSAQQDSSYQQGQDLSYPEEPFQGAPTAIGVAHADMTRYAPPANEYTYAAGHGQEPFATFT